MSTDNEITKLTRKFDEILSKRHNHNDSNKSAYQNLDVLGKLSNTKFPVYLVYSQITNQNYAMKTFPYVGENPHDFFQNELRFTSLSHPNIIPFVYAEQMREVYKRNKYAKMSYILMEYAPYGDLYNFIITHAHQADDKLVRTYFRQLIEGIKYLHHKSIIHLDIKLENLLLDSHFNLKICDFDLAGKRGDTQLIGRGTEYSRAPELFRSQSPLPVSKWEISASVDIYSAAVILFIMKSRGNYPHAEYEVVSGIDFQRLLYHDNELFWKKHCEMERRESGFYDESFRVLFNGMVRENPEERWSIKQIMQSEWYNGPVYSPVELYNKMKQILNC